MRKKRSLLFFLLLLILPACQAFDNTPVAVSTRQSSAPAATQIPLATVTAPDTVEPLPTSDADPGSSPTAVSAESAVLPAPSIFETTWDNRELFRAGLIPEQQDVLDALPGASVYHMVLNFDEPTAVTGQMEVRYTNQETIPLDSIYFHIFPDQLGGHITFGDVTLNGQAAETKRDATTLQVLLETPIEPGQQAIVQMGFKTAVPSEVSTLYNILGYNEGILALAHFYPMIATYDDHGWHIESSPDHGDETYADMSFFLVQVNAPEKQTVVTSGVEIERGETAGKQNITIAAGPVRDFYLVMSERFNVVSDHAGPVQINSYAPRELLDGAGFALQSAGHALQSYNERFGPYPYRELDIVSTPTQALGVEYPGIFANALRIYDLDQAAASGLPNAVLLESVTAHEVAHQWFYNLVGNDQLNEPWLDEALAQYVTWMYYVDRYGEEAAQPFYDSLEGRWARNEFADIPIGLPAEDYDAADYGAIVYGRGPIFLNQLAQEMGQETFDAFLRDYSEVFRWQIATSEEFQALAEEHCNCDLSTPFAESVYAR
ncbi:MAG: hypothetical protein GWP61_07890 [Chloroflexi bacterium]|nr:hypothetical protein [Chloroflexota bacterium]